MIRCAQTSCIWCFVLQICWWVTLRKLTKRYQEKIIVPPTCKKASQWPEICMLSSLPVIVHQLLYQLTWWFVVGVRAAFNSVYHWRLWSEKNPCVHPLSPCCCSCWFRCAPPSWLTLQFQSHRYPFGFSFLFCWNDMFAILPRTQHAFQRLEFPMLTLLSFPVGQLFLTTCQS